MGEFMREYGAVTENALMGVDELSGMVKGVAKYWSKISTVSRVSTFLQVREEWDPLLAAFVVGSKFSKPAAQEPM
eukprot:2554352-Karenia_brevis.AAC.1